MSILEMVQKYGVYREVSPGEYAGPCPECGGAMRFRVFPALNQGKCQFCTLVLDGAQAGFDAIRMEQLMTSTLAGIQAGWRQDGWEWLERNKQKVVEFIKAKERAIDALFAAEDGQGLTKALEVLEKAYRRAWKLYETRPPVIEREEADTKGPAEAGAPTGPSQG